MNAKQEEVELQYDVEAMLVPSGFPVNLKKGTKVFITQALGGTFTIHINGNLARIEQEHAAALGKEDVCFSEDEFPEGMPLKDKLWQKLKSVYDPEIPVNIVDLGLIYDVIVEEPKGGKSVINIRMTLTAPGCGMGPVLMEDVKRHAESFDEVEQANVELVFDPPWHRDLMTQEAKLMLGMM